MKFLIFFIVSFFFFSSNASAFCIAQKQAFPSKIAAIPSKKSVFTPLKWAFQQRLALKYLSKPDKRGKKAIDGFFIAGFLLIAVGVIVGKTSGFGGGIIAIPCFIFGGLLVLTGVVLSARRRPISNPNS
jgi:hypothetical protein